MIKNKKILIIGEAGINHNGKLKYAQKLIDIAARAKIDYIKFQLFKTEEFINKSIKTKKVDFNKLFLRFKSLEFSLQNWKKLINYGKKKKIKLFFSVFDVWSLEIIKKLKIRLIKIPSGEINNIFFLKKINNMGIDVILSTGMSNNQEILKALKILKNCNVKLLHCVS